MSKLQRFSFYTTWWAVPILSADMLEGLLRQTSTVQGEVVQRGAEQEVVVQWGTEQGVVEVHTYVEGVPDSNIEVFGPWIAAWDRL